MAVAPNVVDNKVDTAVSLNKMAKVFTLHPSSFKRRMRKGIIARRALLEELRAHVDEKKKRPSLVQEYKRSGKTIFTTQYIEDLHHWLLNVSNNVVMSPKANDTVKVFNRHTGDMERRQKAYYRFGLRELHMELTDPTIGWSKTRNEDGDVIIGETANVWL